MWSHFMKGYLGVILVPAGETAPVGEAIALIAETEAEIEAAQKQAESKGVAASATTDSAPAATPTPVAAAVNTSAAPAPNNSAAGNGRIVASPRARKLAKELKVDLSSLRGSGPHGRIVAEDVEAAAGKAVAKAPVAPTTAPPPAPTPTAARTTPAVAAPAPAVPGQKVPLTTLQNAVVRNMVASLEVPTYHVGYTITTDNLDNLYKQIKSKGVTMTVLLAKAVAVTLQKHPLLNACYVDQRGIL
jgi:Pyruvate/2-oxoglutarate dehydrogenase complex, dihydrolipoamide acyltransferase (E2) component, and related enzymes